MFRITLETTVDELAAIISQALESAGIIATLSGGGAVSIYTSNEYQSKDLDFVTAASHEALRTVIEPLGFAASKIPRQFEHPETQWFIEFPPSPLAFGDLTLDSRRLPLLQTAYGPLRIVTPTLSVLDRLAACWYHSDAQAGTRPSWSPETRLWTGTRSTSRHAARVKTNRKLTVCGHPPEAEAPGRNCDSRRPRQPCNETLVALLLCASAR